MLASSLIFIFRNSNSQRNSWAADSVQMLPDLRSNRCFYAQRNLFEILLNHTELRLYLPFSDWFGTKWTSVWFQINRQIVNTIWFRFDSIIFRKDFCVCQSSGPLPRGLHFHFLRPNSTRPDFNTLWQLMFRKI